MSPRVKALLRLQSDERLAALAADGDEAAFEALVRRHRRWIVAACARVMPGDRAEDAAQQALLSAHQALLRNGPPRHPQAWLRRIAVNAALKEAGREGPDTEELDEDTMDGVPRPEEVAETRELLTRTVTAVGELPARQRRALVMRELEGKSHAEIAAALGLSRGAIRQLIHRARDGVRSVATALTPLFLVRGGGGASGPATEIAAGGVLGLGGKAAVTLVVTGGIAGTVALAPPDLPTLGQDSKSRKAGSAMVDSAEAADGDEASGSRGSGSGERGRKKESSGRGHRRGPGERSDSSGSGSGGSGSGSGGSGSSFDSDSGGSGSGISGGGSGSSGSGSSESDTSGSGSESSGSGGGDEIDD